MSKKNNTNKKKTINKINLPIILIGVSITLIAASVFLVIMPKKAFVEETKVKIIDEELNIKLLEVKLKELKELKQKLELKEEEAKANPQEYIIPQLDKTQILSNFDFLTHESMGYELSQISFTEPKPMAEGSNIGIVTITIDISATPDKLIDLVNMLEKETQIYLIENFEIIEGDKLSGEESILTIDITTYYVMPKDDSKSEEVE